MGGIYAYLIDSGYSAEYLDSCTLLDIDLHTRKVNELQKRKRGDKS